MSDPIIPVILAGGTGSRLWPLSRDSMPKQFLALRGSRTTFQETLLRVRHTLFRRPVIVTGTDFRFLAQRQAQEVDVDGQLTVEPTRRDSAAAIVAGAMVAAAQDPKAVVLALAADHVVLDRDAFHSTCESGRAAADAGYIVTFGISPTGPRTAYGYISPGSPIGDCGVYKVANFIEKPDQHSAERYVRNGYLWNSGNFLFRADVMLNEMTRFQPELVSAVRASIMKATTDLNMLRLDLESFAKAPQLSIDYALMEKTDLAAVVRGDFGWSDIGSWDSLADLIAVDIDSNIVHGDAVNIDSHGCIIHTDDKLIATLGVNDLVIVSTADAVMVAPRGRSQDVRKLVQRLKDKNRPEASIHPRVDRPWGYYESLDTGPRFQVKRIVVYRGGALSLQKHCHRAEHWVVVSGTAEVTIGDQVRTIYENQSVYIPLGTLHRLVNRGRIPLELIEVQTGSYLGEDDIVRIEDD
jgi:mannose-1-phosphate guanylyltransferase/mannose-6-phosphate isomerase